MFVTACLLPFFSVQLDQLLIALGFLDYPSFPCAMCYCKRLCNYISIHRNGKYIKLSIDREKILLKKSKNFSILVVLSNILCYREKAKLKYLWITQMDYPNSPLEQLMSASYHNYFRILIFLHIGQ